MLSLALLTLLCLADLFAQPQLGPQPQLAKSRPSVFVSAASASASASDPLSYVDPLIGSRGGGNVFAGATLPYGLAKAVADVDGQNTGGFSTDGSNVTGFSGLHDSGTGGNPSLGNFPLFPQLCRGSGDGDGDGGDDCLYRIDDRKVRYVNGSVEATPGRFAIELETGIRAEMTVSEHAALYRFSFPPSSSASQQQQQQQQVHPHIMLDLTDLWRSRQNASVRVDADSGRMTGNGTFLPSFGAGSYVLHFCVDFYGADVLDSGVWVNSRGGTEPRELYVTRGFNLFYLEAGGFVRFKTAATPGRKGRDGRVVITARVGISFKSGEQACRSAEREIPEPLGDFERLAEEARRAWRDKLSAVEVVERGGASEELLRSFWSGAYRSMISPQNYTGENPDWDTGRPYFDSFYCLWDAFRVQHPFLTVVDPKAQAQMVQTLIDMYEHDGWLPDCHMSMCSGWTQGGSNADVVIADAYHKNLTGGGGGGKDKIDWDAALRALVADAEDEPLEWSVHGRGGLRSWKRAGYVPYLDYDPAGFGTNSRSVSRTLEYAYDDYCIGTVAGAMGGRRELEARYLRRSTNWRNLWRAEQTSFINGSDTGFRGFFQPRYRNGSWGFQDPIACSKLAEFCSLTTNPSETFEASVWQYLFYVPHSVASLIDLMGGDEAFIKRLDYFHTVGLADISNEPVFLTVYMYHYAGRPGLSARRLRTSYIPSKFRAEPDGLPGNDDSGAMGSFYWFSVLGLFPVAGQDVYLIGAPMLGEVRVRSGQTGRTATVRCWGGCGDGKGTNVYVQSVRVNGEAWTRSWIGHEFFLAGWTMEVVLGAEESGWGRRVEDRPPSFGGEKIGLGWEGWDSL